MAPIGQIDKFLAKARQEGIHSAIVSAARFALRKLGIRGYEKPYEYVQTDVGRNLHCYLRVRCSGVQQIIIVGAHFGNEVLPMLRKYPEVKFHLFEASPRYINTLNKRFASEQRVRIHGCAVSDSDGTSTFFETNLDGSGSLLQVGDLARDIYGAKPAESYSVETTRLDTHARMNGYAHEMIACLWMDVQGAEMRVLRGARDMLTRTHSVFTEISIVSPLYEGGAMFHELEEYLRGFGFQVVSIGTDAANGTGNALFVRAADTGGNSRK